MTEIKNKVKKEANGLWSKFVDKPFQTVIIIFLMILTWKVWMYTEGNLKELVEWQLAPIIAVFTTLITGLVTIAKQIIEEN